VAFATDSCQLPAANGRRKVVCSAYVARIQRARHASKSP
jgi:hypothetical protein